MTFIENYLKMNHKSIHSRDAIIQILCPHNVGLENRISDCDGDCEQCWNREIPETENKEPVKKEEQPIFVSNQMRRDMLDARSSFIARFHGDLVGAIGDRAKAYELTKMAFEKGWFG